MIFFGVFLVLLVHLTHCRECYKCGSIIDGFKNTCDHFDPSLSEYKENCPAGYRSCSIQYKGESVVRQCENIRKINDCKIANDVKYCYCTTDLCNDVYPKRVSNENNILTTDDEDILEEGSGYSSNVPGVNKENKETKESPDHRHNFTTREKASNNGCKISEITLFITTFMASLLLANKIRQFVN